MRDTPCAPGAQQFSAHLIVGDFRNHHTYATSQQIYQPLLASQALRRRAWIRHETERPSIQYDDHRHIMVVLREQFAGGRAIFIERTDEHLERLALLLRVFALPCVKERDQRLILLDLRKTPLFWRLIVDVIWSGRGLCHLDASSRTAAGSISPNPAGWRLWRLLRCHFWGGQSATTRREPAMQLDDEATAQHARIGVGQRLRFLQRGRAKDA